MKHFTLDDLINSACAQLNTAVITRPLEKPKSKYRNTKTEVNGIKFDSAKEAAHYKKLLLLQKAGKIGLLELQVPYELNAGGTYSLKYIADFVYTDSQTGRKHVVDVKGYRTAEYKKKRKLMLKVHEITIEEV